MTVVGDIAQATGPLAPESWDDVLQHLPDKREPRVIGLSVGYRIPAQIMELANRVMAAATPGLRIPTSVRIGDASPEIIEVDDLFTGTVNALRSMIDALPGGGLAVVVPDELSDRVSAALNEAGIAHGRAVTAGLDESVTVVPVSVVKGLELDGVIVVEPSRIVDDEPHGLRALYVALTRSTQRLTVVHHDPLPVSLQPT
jgi:DNA helicase IV